VATDILPRSLLNLISLVIRSQKLPALQGEGRGGVEVPSNPLRGQVLAEFQSAMSVAEIATRLNSVTGGTGCKSGAQRGWHTSAGTDEM
jgi:hypothetical protein